MRNYSGGVSGALCPEYFHSEDRKKSERLAAEAPGGRIVLPSKGRSERKTIRRKAVKECYCYAECRKNKQHAKKPTAQSGFPCDYCRSNFDVEISLPTAEDVDRPASVLLPLSGEAFRRVERITYSPTSEFLRRVQRKFSSHRNVSDDSSSEITATSSHKSGRLTRDSGRGESAADVRCRGGRTIDGNGESGRCRSRSYSRVECEVQPRTCERRSMIAADRFEQRRSKKIDVLLPSSRSSAYGNVRSDGMIADGQYESVARKPRTLLRKTIRSVECPKDDSQKKERTFAKHSGRRIARTISAHSRCCARGDDDNFETKRNLKICSDSHSCPRTRKSSREARDRTVAAMGDSDEKVREVNKFRNDNYFETHGSTQTLVGSSRSSGSIEQYVLNDRLFPEAVGRIHRNDLVVTMPPCATKQRKRIHYFPRHIVKQEKNIGNINYNRKKRRSQSCGLTGHAVDLGILKKPCEVTNSLALRYQKGVTMAYK